MTTSPRLLVVDDDLDFARLVQDVGEGCGYVTRAAADGYAAQAAAREFRPDVVVLDMVMPEADGIDYIRWLAATGFAGRLLLTTGYDTRYLDMARIIARSSGLADIEVLTKPARPATLAGVLNRWRAS